MSSQSVARRNAKTIVAFTTAYPFRLPASSLMCVYCYEDFAIPSDFREHMAQKHTTFRLQTAFPYSSGLHLKVDLTDLRCRICDQRFDDLLNAAKHLNDSHIKITKYVIDLTQPIGLQPYKFTDNKNICCVLCAKRFPAVRLLSRHMATHYLSYTCAECGKSYATNETLQHHIRTRHVPGQHICLRCRRGFSSLEERRAHMESTENCWPYNCYECCERFLTYKLKQKHLVEVHGVVKKQPQCLECGKLFKCNWSCNQHFAREHNGKRFMCTECGRDFCSNKNLVRHNEVVHNKKMHYECSICCETFSKKRDRDLHMKDHGV